MERAGGYSEALTEEICARLARGRSLSAICRDEDMPASGTVFYWLARRPEFARAYAAARDAQAHTLFDELLAIADAAPETPGGVSKARLMVDTRKWWLSKVAPRVYGEKLEPAAVDEIAALTPEARRARIKVLLDKAEADRTAAAQIDASGTDP